MNEERQFGDCYESSYKNAKELDILKKMYEDIPLSESIEIVHGSVTPDDGINKGRSIEHAWIEVGDTVIETSNGQQIPFSKNEFYKKFQAAAKERYSINEADHFVKNLNGYGKWREKKRGRVRQNKEP